MLDLRDDWVWDFWVVDAADGAGVAGDTGATDAPYHLFFLKAPRSLGDPDLRHTHASVGHAVSTDLRTWQRLADALDPQPPPAYDDLATWTGSVVRGDDGRWHQFTSGISRAERGVVQRIGVSVSPDLTTWTRLPAPVLEADARWYLRTDGRRDEHWRDPWVRRGPDGLWHMYVTAQAAGTAAAPDGVVGHATSRDLHRWEVGPPLSRPTGRFQQLEVVSLAQVAGRWALVFSCLSTEMPGAASRDGGVWSVPVDGVGTPVEIGRAVRLTSEDLYVGRVVTRRDASTCLLAFENRDASGSFSGGVIDPVDVAWNAAGTGLELRGAPERWRG